MAAEKSGKGVDPWRYTTLADSVENTFTECLEILRKKNNDYAGTQGEFSNFETGERIGVSVQKAIMIRLLDKITRLENLLVIDSLVTEETFEDTINDAINYLAILRARRQWEHLAGEPSKKDS